MTAILQKHDNANEPVLHLALEVSDKRWKLGFSNGEKQRRVTVDAGDWVGFHGQLERAKAKLGLPGDCRVVSCYEAGQDGFWPHRQLEAMGIVNRVVDYEIHPCISPCGPAFGCSKSLPAILSASIEVNRRHRRAKTDGLDACRELAERCASCWRCRCGRSGASAGCGVWCGYRA